MAGTKKIDTERTEQSEPQFSKEQILASVRYANRRDLVDALLSKYPDTRTFDFETIDRMIENYKKGKVK